tara:strand:- start:184 stop:492 length:309 start_codon:yes stop_codon:yes gene_type:complete
MARKKTPQARREAARREGKRRRWTDEDRAAKLESSRKVHDATYEEARDADRLRNPQDWWGNIITLLTPAAKEPRDARRWKHGAGGVHATPKERALADEVTGS